MSEMRKYETYTSELEPEPMSVFGKVEVVLATDHEESLRAEYNRGWNDCTVMIANQQAARLSKKAQRTSREAVARNADSIKGVRRDVLTALGRNPLGLTDFDLEDALGRSHQSVSAARNSLMLAGLVTDSGKTRPNARGNRCIVWVVSSPSSKDENVPNPDPVPIPTPPGPSVCPECGDLLVSALSPGVDGCLRCGFTCTHTHRYVWGSGDHATHNCPDNDLIIGGMDSYGSLG